MNDDSKTNNHTFNTTTSNDNGSTTHSFNQSRDALYNYNAASIEAMRESQPWANDVKYFKQCKVSTLAAMKMLKHALLGVQRGRADNGVPQEIMGLMIGKPDDDAIVIMDVAPLPVTGTETRVVADDAQMYMINLLESLEVKRMDRFIGWYHSHPFDVESYSHCHLSNTDVLTQQNWQRTSPMWVAIVVDPLRSLALQRPEFGAYRVYPQNHRPPTNECPDATVSTDDSTRSQRWGHSHNQYYELDVSYFHSELAGQLLHSISSTSVWASVLSTSPQLVADTQQKLIEQINRINNKLSVATNTSHLSPAGYGGGGRGKRDTDVAAAVKDAQNIAAAAEKQCVTMQVKQRLFNSFNMAQAALQQQQQSSHQSMAHSNSQQGTVHTTLPMSTSSMQLT